MKELSIKEKYEMALGRARELYMSLKEHQDWVASYHAIENIFPELREESEDERIRKEIYWFLTQPDTVCDKRWIAWLEKQNLIMAKSPQLGGQKSAWSEKDSPYYDDICEILRNLILIETDKINKDFVQKDLDWLKSLKDRYSWKPSEEQMEVLKALVEDNNQRYFYTTLNSLYEQLKKLREE